MLHLNYLMTGRIYKDICAIEPSLLQNCTIAELQELKSDIDALIKRKLDVPKDIQTQIDAISSSYMAIDFGESPEDARTISAVALVDQLNFSPVVNAVLSLENGNVQWEFAVKLSKVLSRILFNAEGYAEKYVNGQAGQFCPRTASIVLEMWKAILRTTPANSIDSTTFKKAIDLHPYCLGTYGDLSFIRSSHAVNS